MQKFNKKILSYKCKIRELQEDLNQSHQEISSLRNENEQMKQKFNNENKFQDKITLLKTEYETKMKRIIDEVKGKLNCYIIDINRE